MYSDQAVSYSTSKTEKEKKIYLLLLEDNLLPSLGGLLTFDL